MRSESYLRYLLSDNVSLRKYFRERKSVSLKEVSRSLLVKVRSLGYAVPDHYYRLGCRGILPERQRTERIVYCRSSENG